MIKAILFDMDGVLIDATEWHYEALNRALVDCGYKPIKRDDHLKKYNGLPTKQKLKIMGIDDPKIIELKKKYTSEIIKENCKIDHTKIEMLYELSKKYKIACCSNAILESVVDMLERSGIYKYFDLVQGNDNLTNPKPDPEIYLKAFEKLDVKPEECLIVEDAPHGIEAAKASGAVVIAVRGYEDVNIELFRRLEC
jgi:beta-phosphoglucomutase